MKKLYWAITFLIKTSIILVVLAILSFLTATQTLAAPPANFQRSLVIGTGLDGPSGFDFAPDGRIFILQRTGEVKIYKNGALLPQNFATLPSIAEGDRGMIGIAFDPQFSINHYVYFYYTGLDKLNRLVRFNASSDVGTDGPYILYQTTFPSEQLHVGGSIAFGPDGKLYFAVGDNGYPPNGQDLSNPHGKILRINKDGSIPADNPFVGQPDKLPEIWAYGFRNPWRFQFDKSTGELYGGDVGDFSIEEVNHIVKGNNYGWSVCEGPCTNPAMTNPIYSYPHANESAAVTGGPIYRSSMFPTEYQGNLFFGDYAKGFIKRCILTTNDTCSQILDFDPAAGSVVDMKISPIDGSLYYITYIPGRMYQVTYSTGNHYPVPQSSANVTKGTDPLTVNFSSTGSTDPDGDSLSFKWNFGDGTTSTQANPTKIFSNKGTYTVELAVSDGINTSQAIPLVIQVGNPPVLTIGAPHEGDTYKAGDTISYTASAIDGAGFDINDGSIKTNVVFHHGTHIHPFLNNLVGRTHSFQTPTTGEESADTWFEIQITATDTNNISTTKSVNVYPVKSTFTLTSNFEGLKVLLDGIPTTTTKVIEGVVGFIREISAPAIQMVNGTVYAFERWADNTAPRHKITTNSVPTTYTAIFKQADPFKGEYFDNMTLTGAPKVTRNDPEINFTWDDLSPDPLIPSDKFSARWTKKQYFAFGRYTFTAQADDGFRLFIDGNQVIDGWTNPSLDKKEGTIDLNAGDHDIRFEYFEDTGGAVVHLNWDLALTQPDWINPTPTDGFLGEYFDNQTLSGAPKVTRNDQVINFNWDNISPDQAIPVDHFSARWTKSQQFTDGNYEFSVTADDGVRLFVDGELLIDKWINQPATTYKATKQLTAGNHTIKMEYFENDGSALAKMTFAPTNQPTPPPTTDTFTGQYWNTPTQTSKPTIPTTAPDLTRDDQAINFNWDSDSPDPKINLDHFVTRWTKTTQFEAADYMFTITADDGIRVLIDDVPVIDKWLDQGSTTYSATKTMSAGTHTIKVEYYENAGGAVVMFNYQKSTTPPPAEGYTAKYWNTPTAATTPTIPTTQPDLTRVDQDINFIWNDASPDPKINLDHFITQWTKSIDLPAGKYKFSTTSDDGIRVYVDDQIVIDQWNDHGSTILEADKDITAGSHSIKVEYYENSGGAIARFSYLKTGEIPPPTSTDFELYTDALLANWENWSWGATINLDTFNPVQTGTKSLSFIADTAWAGLRLHTSQGVDFTGYKTVTFVLKATNDNQVYEVSLYTANNQKIGQSLPLTNYGGNPVAANWKLYSIPLADFGGNINNVQDVVFQSIGNNPQPALYIDQLVIKNN